MTHADNADDVGLLTNITAPAEYLLLAPSYAAGDICLHMIADKTEIMCFKRGAIFILVVTSKISRQVHLVSNISSTEYDVSIRLAKAWTTFDRLSIIWKSDLSNKIKKDFLQGVAVLIQQYECIRMTLKKWTEKKTKTTHE